MTDILARAVMLLLLLSPPVLGQVTESETRSESVTDATETSPSKVERLMSISSAAAEQRDRLEGLERRLAAATDALARQEIEAEIETTRGRIAKLNAAFEQVGTGGVTAADLVDAPSEEINWRAELEMISLPILASLRDLTEKPRRIEELRAKIDTQEERLALVERAAASVEQIDASKLEPAAKQRLADIAQTWRARESELQTSLETARYQLALLTGDDTSWGDELRDAFAEFGRGRGLTLLIALAAGTLAWLVTWGIRTVYQRVLIRKRGRAKTTRLRIVEYAFRTGAALLVFFAVMAVFYIRSDLLLLALSAAALVGLLLMLRQVLPRYVKETRLLLDIGPVRDGERVVVDGVPYKVASINMFSILRNPRLQGVLRLPLLDLDEMTSRPAGEEAWFPTEPNDFVLLADGTFGQVLSQTIERVELKVAGSTKFVDSSDFLSQGIRNLSAQGFSVSITFGIDYQHQNIALDAVPETLRAGVQRSLEAAGVWQQVRDLTVDFKEAGASSLDYLILASMDGEAAGLYFKLGRLMQQACVANCNEQGWTIPFPQLTVHPGEGFGSGKAILAPA